MTAQATTWASTSRLQYLIPPPSRVADYYVIAVVQHRERMSSSLPATGTLLREYVQLETTANASCEQARRIANCYARWYNHSDPDARWFAGICSG